MLALIDLRDESHDLLSTLRELQSAHASALSSTSSSLSLLTELRRLSAERADLLRSASEQQVVQSQQIPYFAAKQREYERDTKDIEVSDATAGEQQSRRRSMRSKQRYHTHFSPVSLSFVRCVAQQRLSRAGWNESLSHASLTALSAEIAQISTDIEPIDAQLQVFEQLPPVRFTPSSAWRASLDRVQSLSWFGMDVCGCVCGYV